MSHVFVLANVTVLLLVAPARGGDLVSTIEDLKSTDRFAPDVVELRKDAKLVDKLLEIARDEEYSRPLRSRALALLATVADRASVAKDVQPLDAAVASRIEARSGLLDRLGAALARVSVEGVTARDLAPEGTAELDKAALSELAPLARDPLLGGRERAVLIRFLPLTRAVSVDPVAVAASIAKDETSPEARIAALGLVSDEAPRLELARILAASLEDPDARVRARVLEAMPLLAAGGQDPIKAFAEATLGAGSSLDRRVAAIEALGRTRSVDVKQRLEDALQKAAPITEDRVRVAALVALGRTGARPAAEVAADLVELLCSGSAESQGRAIDGLGELPESVVVDALHPRLYETSVTDDVRLRAIQAARALGLKGLASDLIGIAYSLGSTATRTAAIRALEVTGDPYEAAEAIGLVLVGRHDEPDLASLRRAAALALGAPALRGDRARSKLAEVLDDESSIVRLAALRALGGQADTRAVEPLVKVVRQSDKPAREKAQAIRSLDRLGAHEDAVANGVCDAIDDDPKAADVAIAAIDYLAQASRQKAIPVFLRLLESPDASVRVRAHASLIARTDLAKRADVDPFGYEAAAGQAERSEAVGKWRRWWEGNKDK